MDFNTNMTIVSLNVALCLSCQDELREVLWSEDCPWSALHIKDSL